MAPDRSDRHADLAIWWCGARGDHADRRSGHRRGGSGAGHLIASLYGVPILLAAPLWRPRAVVALAVLVVTLYAVAGAVQGDDLELWLLYALSLAMIAALGILLSVQRRQTEQRAHEAEIARQQLQTFMSMVAHELSTPTTGILGRAQLALRTARQSRERRALAAIEAEAVGLARLVNDLRDAGRAGSGSFEIDPVSTDLAALIARVVERQRRSARNPARNREIVLEIAEEPHLECDPGRIGQVVDNLISNAIKYSPPGEPITVRLSARRRRRAGLRDGSRRRDRGGGAPSALPAVLATRRHEERARLRTRPVHQPRDRRGPPRRDRRDEHRRAWQHLHRATPRRRRTCISGCARRGAPGLTRPPPRLVPRSHVRLMFRRRAVGVSVRPARSP